MTPLGPADGGRLAEALARDYGVSAQALEGWTLRTPTDGEAVFATRADPADVPAPAVRAGVRLGSWTGDGLRLSIEGAALLEDHLDPIVDIGDDRAKAWLAGDDVPAPDEVDGPFLVLRWRGRVVGTAEVRDGVLENHLPRGRRIAHPPWEGGPDASGSASGGER